MTATTTYDWDALTTRSLEELRVCDEQFRPTSFWGPGLDQLLSDMGSMELARFKSWPTASFWFYPRYGQSFTNASMKVAFDAAHAVNPKATEQWMRGALSGGLEGRRDFDAVRLAWDQQRWPFDLEGQGESRVGEPAQYYPYTQAEHGWTRPYLNYLLCLSALSQHVERPPQSFLEIGGGFGVLGEILMSRDPQARYVDLDIPPLLTVASYYLTTLYGDRVQVYDEATPATGPLEVRGSAVLPNYRLGDLRGDFEVFVNTYSFQEMEPHVVDNYVELVAATNVEWVVSVNSRLGKPRHAGEGSIGVMDPVTSARIVEMFERRGFRLVQAYGSPLLHSAAELAVLRRS